jgi:hypothetical protein
MYWQTLPERAGDPGAGELFCARQSDGVTKTQYYTATSLDGYIANEHNSLEWLFEVDRAGADDHFTRFFAAVGAMAVRCQAAGSSVAVQSVGFAKGWIALTRRRLPASSRAPSMMPWWSVQMISGLV